MTPRVLYNRVACMSRAEIRHRVRVALRRRFGWLPGLDGGARRDDAWVARLAGNPSARADLPGYLGRVLGSRVYGHDWWPGRLAEGLTRAGAADGIVAEAEAIRAHRLRVLGYGVCEAGATIDWHRDPVTGTHWPRRYWGLQTRGFHEGWDPKVIWEPSR